jgi:hypothetical protein
MTQSGDSRDAYEVRQSQHAFAALDIERVDNGEPGVRILAIQSRRVTRPLKAKCAFASPAPVLRD